MIGIQNETGNDVIYAVVRRKDDSLSEQYVIDYVNGKLYQVLLN